MSIEEGKAAPAFTLEDTNGNTVALADLKGQNVIVYFYPKDDTPGCTAEACSFRDQYAAFAAAGVRIFGVSILDARSKTKFAQKNALNYPLLADAAHTLAEAYGVWIEKSMYGKKYMGIQRSTFVVGPDGRIELAWDKVKPEDHAAEVLRSLPADG